MNWPIRTSLLSLAIASAFPLPARSQTQTQTQTQTQPAASAASARRVSSGVMYGLLLKRVNPTYTAEQLAKSTSGVVVMSALIGKDGSVTDLSVISGAESLRQPTLDAVRQWRYRPYLLNGQPVEVQTTITFDIQRGAPASNKK